MIIRVFRAHVKPESLEAYEDMLNEKAIPLLKQQEGLVALHVGTPMDDGSEEFVLVSVWKDLPSLIKFTGDNWKQAVILPGEAQMIANVTVEHYDGVPT